MELSATCGIDSSIERKIRVSPPMVCKGLLVRGVSASSAVGPAGPPRPAPTLAPERASLPQAVDCAATHPAAPLPSAAAGAAAQPARAALVTGLLPRSPVARPWTR